MRPTGADVLALARSRIGDRYVFGVLVPKNDGTWDGPWDCAEFCSWLVYQWTQTLYGCRDPQGDPAKADAYTGYWARDCRLLGTACTVLDAADIPGAFVLRAPGEGRGHIVVSDGRGSTVEAHSTARGVIAGTLRDRAWTTGILVPGIDYSPAGAG